MRTHKLRYPGIHGKAKTVQRVGYAAVIGLLMVASVDALRVQRSEAEQRVEIYRAQSQEDEAVSELGRAIWLAGGAVRDFFIKTDAEGAERLTAELKRFHLDSDDALRRLHALRVDRAAMAKIEASVQDFWAAMEPVPVTMLHEDTDQGQYAFVQNEIVPRRMTFTTAMEELSAARRRSVQKSEAEFVEARRAAIGRLVRILALCTLLAVVVAVITMENTDDLEAIAQRRYAEVVQAKEELQALSARITELEEELRRSLSRELHDSLGQSLAVLQIEVSKAGALAYDRDPELRRHLARARGMAERAVQTVRNISLMLRPPMLDDLGLVAALEWLTDDFSRRCGIPCEFSESGANDHLPDAIKTSLYRIAQEALHNCEKHAQASRVEVRLTGSADAVSIEIQDDGRGFDIESKQGPAQRGLGVLGTRERAARVGGSMTLESSPGAGTRVRVTIPLRRTEAQPDVQARRAIA